MRMEIGEIAKRFIGEQLLFDRNDIIFLQLWYVRIFSEQRVFKGFTVT